MELSRNSPCPCASGKKYKVCCGRVRAASHPAPEEIVQAIEAKQREEHARIANLGHVRPIIHADFQGNKFVAVGAELHYSPTWRTFHDFLFGYIKTVLVRAWGKGWVEQELKKPVDVRHPVFRWYDALCSLQARSQADESGIYEAPLDGPSAAYLMLAYDLYIVGDNLKLQDEVLRRMKRLDHFQGARYELVVTATMIRAGFDIDFEDEQDNRSKHPEFIATHKATGEKIAIEAKSRRRSGVMGWLGPHTPREQFKLGLDNLLRDALSKAPRLPYIIFLDANMPPQIAVDEWQRWLDEAMQMLDRVGHGFNHVGVRDGAPFTAFVLTNHPHDYAAPGSPDPRQIGLVGALQQPKYPLKDRFLLQQIERACQQYGKVPSDFPT